MNIYSKRDLITAENVSYDAITHIEEAKTLLCSAWMRFFGAPGPNDDPKENTAEIGVLLSMCADRLSDALLEFRLETGIDGPDVDGFFSQVEDYREIRDLSRAYNAVMERERTLSGTDRLLLEHKRKQIAKLPPAAAIPALRALLKGGEADAE